MAIAALADVRVDIPVGDAQNVQRQEGAAVATDGPKSPGRDGQGTPVVFQVLYHTLHSRSCLGIGEERGTITWRPAGFVAELFPSSLESSIAFGPIRQ